MPITNRKTGLRQQARPSKVRTELLSVAKGFVDFVTDEGYTAVAVGEVVKLETGYGGGGTATRLYRRAGAAASLQLGKEDYTTAGWTLEAIDTEEDYASSAGSTAIVTGDVVKTAAAYANGGLAERLYEYLGANATVDLSAEDYSVTANWELQAVTGEQDYDTTDGTQIVKTGETVLLESGYGAGGTAGSVYRRKAADATVVLAEEDYSVTATWTLQGTNAAFTARSTANRDIVDAYPDPAANTLVVSNIVRTKNP